MLGLALTHSTVSEQFVVYGASHLLLLPTLAPQENVTSGQVIRPQPKLILTDSRSSLAFTTCGWSTSTGSGGCTATSAANTSHALFLASLNTTDYVLKLYPGLRVTASIREKSGSRSGFLQGNTQAVCASSSSDDIVFGSEVGRGSCVFAFTDLAVVGPYEGYVLEFECDGLPWPVVPISMGPFRVEMS